MFNVYCQLVNQMLAVIQREKISWICAYNNSFVPCKFFLELGKQWIFWDETFKFTFIWFLPFFSSTNIHMILFSFKIVRKMSPKIHSNFISLGLFLNICQLVREWKQYHRTRMVHRILGVANNAQLNIARMIYLQETHRVKCNTIELPRNNFEYSKW